MSDVLAKIRLGQDRTDRNAIRTSLARDGFASLNHVTDQDDIDFISEQIRAIIQQKKGVEQAFHHDLGEIGQVTETTQALDVSFASSLMPNLRQSRFFQRAFELSRQVLGPRTQYLYDHFIAKQPFSQTVTAWHQDDAYSGRISFTGDRMHWWLPLGAVDERNSCMQFVPGSHHRLLPHRRRSPKAFAKETDLPANASVVVCPLPVGGATIHTSRTLHFTGPNHTADTRYAWIVQFGVKRRFPVLLMPRTPFFWR